MRIFLARFDLLFAAFLACSAAHLLSGCGEGGVLGQHLSAGATVCPGNTAEIAVSDGYLEVLCGCAETAGLVVGAGKGPLTCTVAAGTEIFFNYTAITVSHQIVASGTPAIPPSPVSNPKDTLQNVVHAFKVTTPGTYPFWDAYNNALTGQLVVR
jgi:hypothetical protein